MAYNPIRVLDGAILKQYAKVRKVWEAKGHSIYPLSLTLSAVSFPAYVTGSMISAFLGDSVLVGGLGRTEGMGLGALYGAVLSQSLVVDVYGQLADYLEATSMLNLVQNFLEKL